jgi:hypothetical protein
MAGAAGICTHAHHASIVRCKTHAQQAVSRVLTLCTVLSRVSQYSACNTAPATVQLLLTQQLLMCSVPAGTASRARAAVDDRHSCLQIQIKQRNLPVGLLLMEALAACKMVARTAVAHCSVLAVKAQSQAAGESKGRTS